MKSICLACKGRNWCGVSRCPILSSMQARIKLKETMDFAGEAGLYAEDENDFADKILYILNNYEIAKKRGIYGRKIVINEFLWSHSAKTLFSCNKKLF